MNTNNTTMNTNTSAMTTTNNNVLVVRTEKELEKALISKCPHFIFEGPKAAAIYAKLQEVEQKKRAVRNTGIGIGILCLLAVPFTGGTSLLGMGAVAGGMALSTEVILAIISGLVAITTVAIQAIRDYQIKKLERDRLEFIRK